MTHVVGVSRQHRVESDREHARTEQLFVADRPVLGEEPFPAARCENRPDQDEVDARIREARVPEVDDRGKRPAGDEDVSPVEVSMRQHGLVPRGR